MVDPGLVGYAVHTISGGSLKRSLTMEFRRMGLWPMRFSLILMTLIGFLIFTSNASHSLAAQPNAARNSENLNTTDQQTTAPQQEQSRREFKAMLWASIVILVGMFLLIFILFVFRMARSVRRLQNRSERTHTEVIDAWSQYRLPDDPTLDFSDE